MSKDRAAEYTLDDLEKKIDNFEKKKKRKGSKEKGSRKQSRENSMTRSHKSGELAKRIPRMQRSMTQRSATNSKERSISQKTFKRMAALGTSVRNNNENKKHQPVIK